MHNLPGQIQKSMNRRDNKSLRTLLECGLLAAVQACCLAIVLLQPTSTFAAELNITQNQLPVVLGPYLDYYEDPSQNLSIVDIHES